MLPNTLTSGTGHASPSQPHPHRRSQKTWAHNRKTILATLCRGHPSIPSLRRYRRLFEPRANTPRLCIMRTPSHAPLLDIASCLPPLMAPPASALPVRTGGTARLRCPHSPPLSTLRRPILRSWVWVRGPQTQIRTTTRSQRSCDRLG